MKPAFVPFSALLLLIGVLMASGCAATVQYVPLPDMDAEVEEPDHCRVYVLRKSAVGSSIPMGVFDGGVDGSSHPGSP